MNFMFPYIGDFLMEKPMKMAPIGTTLGNI